MSSRKLHMGGVSVAYELVQSQPLFEAEYMSLTSQMTGNMVPLDTLDSAPFPSACQAQIIGTLPADMDIAKMVIQLVCGSCPVFTCCPPAFDLVVIGGHHTCAPKTGGVTSVDFRGDGIGGGWGNG